MIPREHTCGGQQFGRAIAECSSCNTAMVCMIHGPEGSYTGCHSSADPVMGSHVHSAAVCVSFGHTTHSGRGMNVSASTMAANWDKPAPNCFDCGIKKQSAHWTLKKRPNLYRVYQERAQSTRTGTWCRFSGLTDSMAIQCYDPRILSRYPRNCIANVCVTIAVRQSHQDRWHDTLQQPFHYRHMHHPATSA